MPATAHGSAHPGQQVLDAFLAQFHAADRFPAEGNQLYAVMLRDFYVTLGAKIGSSPAAAQERYPLQAQPSRVVEQASALPRDQPRAYLGRSET